MKDSPDRPQSVPKAALPKRSFDERGRISRRGLVGLLGMAGAGLVLTTAIQAGSKEGKNPRVPEAQKPTAITSPKQVQTQEKPTGLETLSDTDFLNKTLSLPLGTPEREKTEQVYSERAKTLEQVDRGLWVVVDPDLRIDLLNKRYEIRQSGVDKRLAKVPEELLAWCKEEGIYPEVMGISLDAYKRARDIIQKLLDKSGEKFRPDLFDPENPLDIPDRLRGNPRAEDLMMNVGGLAKLMMYETVGFTNIGTLPALSQINYDVFSGAKEQLEEICRIQEKMTGGLKYMAANIPGSTWPRDVPGTISGGAIGPQFMPGKALEMINLLKDVKEDFILFHVTWGAIGSEVHIAQSENLGNGDWRIGYTVGKEPVTVDFRRKSLAKWNGDATQVNTVLGSANRFSNKFGVKYSD